MSVCTISATIQTGDGEPLSGVRIEFVPLTVQVSGTVVVDAKPIIGVTDGEGVLKKSPEGTEGVDLIQGIIAKVYCVELGLRGHKIEVPASASAALETLIAAYVNTATAPVYPPPLADVLAAGADAGGIGITGLGSVVATGGAATGIGIQGTGGASGAALGVYGIGGGEDGWGVEGDATGDGVGVYGYAGGSGNSVYGEMGGSGIAVNGDASSGTGYGVQAKADTTSPVKAALRLVPQDAAPSSPFEGDVYADSVTDKLNYYGAAWQQVYAGNSTVHDRTADINLTRAHVGQIFTNTSAAGQVQCNLPAAPVLGDTYTFIANNGGAFNFVINASTGQVIRLGAAASSSGGAAYWTSVVGAQITMVYLATNVWQILNSTGTAVTLA